MNEVEQEPPFEQGIIQSLQIFACLCALGSPPAPRGVAGPVERDGTLRVKYRDVRDGSFVLEVRLVRGEPREKRPAGLSPAVVLGRATQPVKPRHHSARGGLGHPESGLGRRLGHVPPDRPAVAVRPGHVRDGTVLHHGLRNPPLLGTVPQGSVT